MVINTAPKAKCTSQRQKLPDKEERLKLHRQGERKEEDSMGMEIEVNSLEDMCSLMCDNKTPTPKRKNWIFTFGNGHEHAGYYVKIHGTYGEARAKMFEKYGDKWAFQYPEDEFDGNEVELIEKH